MPIYISYSSVSDWDKCPFYFKLKNVDKIQFDRGSVHTAFGNAVHLINKNIVLGKLPISDVEVSFQNEFKKELKKLPQSIKNEILLDKEIKKLCKEMMMQGGDLCKKSIEQLHIQFPGFKVIAAEGRIIEPIMGYDKTDYEFKAILDLIITTKDDEVIILDWKTTSWGWDVRKRTDKMVTYQLTYYKHYLGQQEDIDVEKIKTYFALIKRTAKEDNIEIFESPVGKKKIENALNVLNNMLYNVDRKNFPKNRLSCEDCPFHKTKHCP